MAVSTSKDKRREYNYHSRLRSVYGIEPEWYYAELAKGCGICGRAWRKGLKRFHVDHDHKTSQVRGVLCYHCNTGLNRFKDSPAILRAAAEYLERDRSDVPATVDEAAASRRGAKSAF